ncbi:MAG: amphi-Trp domain-containing protein, partial [Myxococcota bacterium]
MSGKKADVVFSSKEPKSVEEIGRFLVTVGQKLIDSGSFTVVQAGREVDVSPSGSTRLELKYKNKGYKQEFEIEIEW